MASAYETRRLNSTESHLFVCMAIPMVGSEILLVEVEVGMCAVKKGKGRRDGWLERLVDEQRGEKRIQWQNRWLKWSN